MPLPRLHPDRLAALRPGVQLPGYDRRALRPGILHLGLGAFHRAHQAVYTEDAIAAAGGDWGIVGVSLRSAAVSRQLLPQDCLYSLLAEDGESQSLRVVGVIREVLVAPENPDAVVAAVADPAIRVITLTITEKGYCLAADGESLDVAAPGMAADLAAPGSPRTAIGLLALGLKMRSEGSGAPLTLLSCDNLSGNGRRLARVLRDYTALSFPAVLPWLDAAVACPASMVDRIVPAMTAAHLRRQAKALGARDEAAVRTEPFSQWIIEDNFAAGRPAWEQAGVQLVDDIGPYEDIKLRLLNASHSAIAYCGLLAGRETVDQVMADAPLRRYVEHLLRDELLPRLAAPAGFDLAAHCDGLLRRFANPCLAHRCSQIAMDGSEKISQRWLPTLRDGPAPLLSTALAAWCYVMLYTDQPIDDPRREQLLQLRAGAQPRAARIAATLSCARISGDTVAGFDALLAAVAQRVDIIAARGIHALLSEPGNPAGDESGHATGTV